MDEDEILWHLLENERYAGATVSSTPERKLHRRLLAGTSPNDYRTERIFVEEEEEPDLLSPRRARFAPSPYYNFPASPAPAPPQPPSPQKLAAAAQRERFSRVLTDLELDLGGRVQRGGWAGRRGQEVTAPHQPDPLSRADSWIYGWHPYASDPPPAYFDSPSRHRAAVPMAQGEAGENYLRGPWLPGWQPAPSRAAVEEATDRLLAAEAHTLYALRAQHKALRIWAFGDDPRTRMRVLRAAMRHWGDRKLSQAWMEWRDHTQRHGSRHRRLAARIKGWRVDALRGAWFALRLDRMRGVRMRLMAAVEARLQGATRYALDRWSVRVYAQRRRLEAALILTNCFRRWMLMVQTAMLSSLLERNALLQLDAELER